MAPDSDEKIRHYFNCIWDSIRNDPRFVDTVAETDNGIYFEIFRVGWIAHQVETDDIVNKLKGAFQILKSM